jgi:hypothetical protein
MRRLGVAVLGVLLVLLCAGCKVDAQTTIKLDDDGSGVVGLRVRLDAEAVALVERGGGKLERRIVLSDLKDEGWQIASWARDPASGSATLRMTHTFRDEAELRQLIEQIGGKDGIVRDVELTRSRNFLQDRDGVTLVADLTALKSGVRDDEELASKLRDAGVNVDAVDFVLAQQLRKAFSMRVVLAVPRDKTRSFSVAAGERETVNLSSTKFQTNRLALLLIGAMMVFLALLLYLSASISARRRRTRELQFAAAKARRGSQSQPLM